MALSAAPAVAADTTINGPAGGPVAWSSGDFTITSAGTIGAAGVGVAASGTLGTFSNAGQVMVSQTAVSIAPSSVVSSLGNSGLLQSGAVGVDIGSGAQVSAFSNLAGGTIHGVQTAFANSGGLGWLSNNNLIKSDTSFGVANGGNLGILQNQAHGTIRTDGSGAVAAVYNSGGINTFSNSGSILAPHAYAVIVTGGGVANLSNATGGVINSFNAAIWNNGAIGVLANSGSITSINEAAVRNFVSIDNLTNAGGIGGPTAISNLGAIGSLTNSGTLEAGNIAVDNGGTIQTLTNAGGGLISANYGVSITGSVGVLDNQGTINAASRAILISSNGSLGRLNNSGVVHGYIENVSTHDLTIVGGSDQTYGTLTGYSNGGQAAILNGSSDLRMSGNLLLDDTLFLGGHTLFSSANLRFSRAVSLTGNFNQDGGSLMFAVASPTSYAQLNVAGAAQVRIANAAVGLIPASSGVLAQGQSYTVVQAPAGAISIANDSVQVAGFTGALTNTGHTLVLSLLGPAPSGAGSSGTSSGGSSSGGSSSGGSSSAGSSSGGSSSGGSSTGSSSTGGSSSGGSSSAGAAAPPAATGFTAIAATGGQGSSGAGKAVDLLAEGSTPSAQAFNTVVVPPLAGLSPVNQALALAQLGPLTLSLENGADSARPVQEAVVGQQAGYVAQVQGRAYAGLGSELYGGGLQSPSRGVWGKVVGAGAGGDSAGGAPFSADMVGAVVGSDLVRGEQFYGGLAASWVGTWAVGKGPLSGGSLHMDSYQLTAYGTAAPRAFGGRLTIDALLGVGLNRYKQERALAFLQSAARATYDGEQYSGRLTVGYAFVGRSMTVIPYAGVEEVHVVQHGYTENGAGLADLTVKGVSADTFRHDIGVKFEGAVDVGGGVEMVPSLKVGWGHTYDNGPVSVYSTLAGVTFASLAARPAADGALVGAALAFRSRDRLSMGFEYSGDLRRDFQAHTGAVRVRWRF